MLREPRLETVPFPRRDFLAGSLRFLFLFLEFGFLVDFLLVLSPLTEAALFLINFSGGGTRTNLQASLFCLQLLHGPV